MHGWQQTASRHLLMHSSEDDDDGLDGTCSLLGWRCNKTDHHYLQCWKQPGTTQFLQCETAWWIQKFLDQSQTHCDLSAILIWSVLITYLVGDKLTLDWTQLQLLFLSKKLSRQMMPSMNKALEFLDGQIFSLADYYLLNGNTHKISGTRIL